MWITLRVTGQTECAVEVWFSWYDLFHAIFTVTSTAIRTHNSSLSSVTHHPLASPTLSLTHTQWIHTAAHTLVYSGCDESAPVPSSRSIMSAVKLTGLSLAVIHPSPSVKLFLPLILSPLSSSSSFSNRMFSVQTQLDIISDKLWFSVSKLSVHWLFQARFWGINEHTIMIVTQKCSDTKIKCTR